MPLACRSEIFGGSCVGRRDMSFTTDSGTIIGGRAKFFLVAAAAVSLAVCCTGDVARASSVFSPEWTGIYLGGSIGARKDMIDWRALSGGALSGADAQASVNSQTARLGVFSGINFQLGTVVLGVEGDLGWGKNSRLGIKRLVGFPSASGDQMEIDTNVDGSCAVARRRVGLADTSALRYRRYCLSTPRYHSEMYSGRTVVCRQSRRSGVEQPNRRNTRRRT